MISENIEARNLLLKYREIALVSKKDAQEFRIKQTNPVFISILALRDIVVPLMQQKKEEILAISAEEDLAFKESMINNLVEDLTSTKDES